MGRGERETLTGTWKMGSWKDWHRIISDPAKIKCDNVSSCLRTNRISSSCRTKNVKYFSTEKRKDYQIWISVTYEALIKLVKRIIYWDISISINIGPWQWSVIFNQLECFVFMMKLVWNETPNTSFNTLFQTISKSHASQCFTRLCKVSALINGIFCIKRERTKQLIPSALLEEIQASCSYLAYCYSPWW